MKNPQVQLMVYGHNIREAQVSTDYPGAKIDSLVRLDSPNYLLIYINLNGAQPGNMPLTFTQGGSKKRVMYAIKPRTMQGEDRKGFTNADVLYMLMPDRFANGNPKNDVVKGMRDELCNRNEPA